MSFLERILPQKSLGTVYLTSSLTEPVVFSSFLALASRFFLPTLSSFSTLSPVMAHLPSAMCHCSLQSGS